MPELHIIEKHITKEEPNDPREREMLLWIKYNFRQYYDGNITRDLLRETLILGIEDIISRLK